MSREKFSLNFRENFNNFTSNHSKVIGSFSLYAAIAILVSLPVLIIHDEKEYAKDLVVYVFFLLVVGVIFRYLEFFEIRHKNKKPR